jgi:hypothetical protein
MLIRGRTPPARPVCRIEGWVSPAFVEHDGHSGISVAVNDVADHARSLVRLEGELVALELRQKVAALGAGAAAVAGGILLALFALGFVFAAIAAALATFLPTWAALLIVALALGIVAGIAAAIGVTLLRRSAPPVPERAIAEAKATGEALRRASHG